MYPPGTAYVNRQKARGLGMPSLIDLIRSLGLSQFPAIRQYKVSRASAFEDLESQFLSHIR